MIEASMIGGCDSREITPLPNRLDHGRRHDASEGGTGGQLGAVYDRAQCLIDADQRAIRLNDILRAQTSSKRIGRDLKAGRGLAL